MTDNEIIKALDLCANTKGCRECVLYSMHSANCVKKLQNNALDLINRQKAEIERLKLNLEEAHIDIKEHMAKNERLHEVINGFEEQSHKEFLNYMELSEKYQNAKSEAIKEFAERLKEEYADFDKLNEIIQIENLFLCIDDLVKEMTEGTK